MSLADFGQSFRKARIAAGKTQADVAMESGLSRVAISRLETGALSELGVSKLLNVLRTVGLALSVHPLDSNASKLLAARLLQGDPSILRTRVPGRRTPSEK